MNSKLDNNIMKRLKRATDAKMKAEQDLSAQCMCNVDDVI